jgi:hypothetical protein
MSVESVDSSRDRLIKLLENKLEVDRVAMVSAKEDTERTFIRGMIASREEDLKLLKEHNLLTAKELEAISARLADDTKLLDTVKSRLAGGESVE